MGGKGSSILYDLRPSPPPSDPYGWEGRSAYWLIDGKMFLSPGRVQLPLEDPETGTARNQWKRQNGLGGSLNSDLISTR